MTIGERIRILREEKSISQEELARKLGLKDKSSVCKIEKAGDDISIKSINKYADALGVPISELMGFDVPPSIEESEVMNQYGRLWREGHDMPTDSVSISEAFELYEQYRHLSPENQIAFRTLLKSLQSDS